MATTAEARRSLFIRLIEVLADADADAGRRSAPAGDNLMTRQYPDVLATERRGQMDELSGDLRGEMAKHTRVMVVAACLAIPIRAAGGS